MQAMNSCLLFASQCTSVHPGRKRLSAFLRVHHRFAATPADSLCVFLPNSRNVKDPVQRPLTEERGTCRPSDDGGKGTRTLDP